MVEHRFYEVLGRMPMIFPFALATIIGGIDCTESAASAGDEYDTRSVLFVEAISSLVAGFAGGVIQTTPYIGQPAYKKMGARAGYTLLTALFIGLAGFMGGLTVLFMYFPKSCFSPFLFLLVLKSLPRPSGWLTPNISLRLHWLCFPPLHTLVCC